MKCYSVFGGCLETDVEFPELRITKRSEPRWVFTTAPALPVPASMSEVGAQHIYGDVHARLYRHEAGHRIVVDDTGVFEIDKAGSGIVWEEKAGAWPDFVRSHLIGRVLATALYSRGMLPLHGSAVQFEGGVVGFLAPKRFGKSTLALALTRAGARLVTDDTLPLELGDPVMAWPGVHSVRVAADSMAALGVGDADLDTREGKGIVTSLPETSLATLPAPLAALYLLSPVAGGGEAVPAGAESTGPAVQVSRELLQGVPAAVSLVAHLKIAKMTGAGEIPEVLRRAAAVVRTVPVYRLNLPRNFTALPTVIETIRGWHAAPISLGTVSGTVG